MPPGQAVTLASRKAALRQRIALRREEGAAALEGVRQPFVYLDGALRAWRGLPPLARQAAVPAVMLLMRVVFPRANIALRWLPTFRSLWRSFRFRRR